MNRNGLYALVGALALVVVALVGYLVYEQSQEPPLEIRLGDTRLEVNRNG